jgi:hypothetical protein
VVVVDWPWAARGAGWVDTVLFALDAAVHGGVDPELLVAGSPLVAKADPAAVTDLVLGLGGMWSAAMRRPDPPGFRRSGRSSAASTMPRWGGAGGAPERAEAGISHRELGSVRGRWYLCRPVR